MKRSILLVRVIITSLLIAFSLTGFAQLIAGGNSHSLALCGTGGVRAWGGNADSALGNGSGTDSNLPLSVSMITGITGVSAGLYHSLAVKNDGTAWAWGRNNDGQ